MKNTILRKLALLFFFSLSINGISQCLNANGDMETYTGAIVSSPRLQANTWFNNNVNNWNVSHGSPSFNSAANVWLWAYNGNGEGVYTTFPFVTGNTYQVTFDLWRNGNSDPASSFQVKLASALTPYNGGVIPWPNTPPAIASQSVGAFPWPGTSGWTTVTIFFTATTAGMNQLWFHPELATNPSSGTTQAECRIDNVCIEPYIEDPCNFDPLFRVDSDPYCEIDFTDITTLPTGLTILDIFWDFGDGTTGKGSTIKHFYKPGGGGFYNVCMTVWAINAIGECCKVEYCEEIYVEECDPCDVIQNIDFSVLGTVPTLDFSPIGLPSSLYECLGYHWDFGDGTTATGQFVTHTYLPGTYTVVLTVYYYSEDERRCCSAQISHTGTVPFIASGEESTINQIFETKPIESRIESNSPLTIFPNPSSGQIEMRLNDSQQINKVNVYDQSGKLQYNFENTEGNTTVKLNLNHLKPGIYIVISNNKNGENRQFNRIVIE